MNVSFYKQAIKALERMEADTRHRITQAILGIAKGDIKRLRGHTELYRLRVGDWRIVFSYPSKNSVLVEKISPRGEVYRRV